MRNDFVCVSSSRSTRHKKNTWRPACSPLGVVASEPILGATAYEGGGRAARRPSSKRGHGDSDDQKKVNTRL